MADKDVVMAAVQSAGWALEYASDEFKADKEVIMAAENQEKLAKKKFEDYLKKIRGQN